MWVSDKRLYRTRGGKVVEADDVRATDGASLLCIPGDELPTKPVVEKLERAPEVKAVKVAENKAVKQGENKAKEAADNKAKGKGEKEPETDGPVQPSLEETAPDKQE